MYQYIMYIIDMYQYIMYIIDMYQHIMYIIDMYQSHISPLYYYVPVTITCNLCTTVCACVTNALY